MEGSRVDNFNSANMPKSSFRRLNQMIKFVQRFKHLRISNTDPKELNKYLIALKSLNMRRIKEITIKGRSSTTSLIQLSSISWIFALPKIESISIMDCYITTNRKLVQEGKALEIPTEEELNSMKEERKNMVRAIRSNTSLKKLKYNMNEVIFIQLLLLLEADQRIQQDVKIFRKLLATLSIHPNIRKIKLFEFIVSNSYPQIRALVETQNKLEEVEISYLWSKKKLTEIGNLISKKPNIVKVSEDSALAFNEFRSFEKYMDFLNELKSTTLRKIKLGNLKYYPPSKEQEKTILNVLSNCPNLGHLSISTTMFTLIYPQIIKATKLQSIGIDFEEFEWATLTKFLLLNPQLEMIGFTSENREKNIELPDKKRRDVTQFQRVFSSLKNIKFLEIAIRESAGLSYLLPIISLGMKHFTKLQELKIGHQMQEDDFNIIFSLIADSRCIKVACLKGITIKQESLSTCTIRSFERLMNRNKSLEQLDLSVNWKIDSPRLAKALTIHKKLRKLFFTFNSFSDEAICGFLEGLKLNRSLNNVRLGYNISRFYNGFYKIDNKDSLLLQFYNFLQKDRISNLGKICMTTSPTNHDIELIEGLKETFWKHNSLYWLDIHIFGRKIKEQHRERLNGKNFSVNYL